MTEQSIGSQLAELRNSKGLSQRELAELSGIQQPAISRIESGRASPHLSTLCKLAEALGCTLSIEFVPIDSD